MRFIHHEDDHRARVSETKSSHASYFSREAVRRRAQDDSAALQITLGKLDENVRMSKLGNVLDRFLRERVGASSDGSVYEGDVEQATQTKASVVHDAGMSRIHFKCIMLRAAWCVQLHL